MTLQLMPTLECNFDCDYCYEQNNRSVKTWDEKRVSKLKNDLLEEINIGEERVVLHGGEVTIIPLEYFEDLLRFVYEINRYNTESSYSRTSLQTNGYNITDKHIELFKEFNTSVGVSIDGDSYLNSKRGFSNKDNRNEQYKVIMNNIKKLRSNNVEVSIISIINENHMGNAKRYIEWLKELIDLGITGGRLNLVDKGAGNSFTHEDAIEFFKQVGNYILNRPELNFSPYDEMIDNLIFNNRTSCSFTKCDMNATQSCKIIHGDGMVGSCLHPARFSDEVPERNENTDFVVKRYEENLPNIPMEDKGCKDCKYWKLCYGGCPSLADNPLTERSSDCKIHYRLYEWLESRIKGMLPNIKLWNEDYEQNPFEIMIKERSANKENRGNKKKKDKNNWSRVKYPEDNRKIQSDNHTDRVINSQTGEIVEDYDN